MGNEELKVQHEKLSFFKIAFVLPTLGAGGAERTTIQIANSLSVAGFSVYMLVAYCRDNQAALRGEIDSQITVIDFDCIRMRSMIPSLTSWIRRIKPALIISSQTHANIISHLAIRISGQNVRHICREVSTPSINLSHLHGFKKLIILFLMRKSYIYADYVIAVSKGVADDIPSYLGVKMDNIKVIYNPVINSTLFQKSSLPVEHPWLVNGHEIPVVLAVGRLTLAKNYMLLIEAAKKVNMIRPVYFLILGEGEERVALQNLINSLELENHVKMLGFDINPFRYMSRCDAYVMSSDWEGLPGSLIQAVALGAKVVSTDCPSGPREILRDGQRGILVECNNIGQLTDAIIQTISTPKIINNTSIELTEFEEETVMSTYISLIGDVLSHAYN